MSVVLLAIAVLELSRNGIDFKVEADRTQIDPGRSVFLTVTMKSPKDVKAVMPDFRDRVRGFSLAEDFAEEPVRNADGSLTEVVNWKLVPEPCAKAYKLAPFAIRASPRLLSSLKDEGKFSFRTDGPIVFEPPPARESVTGEMECEPKKDLPPLSWKLVGRIAFALAALAVLVAATVFGVKLLARKLREHRMSPIERAWVELERLLKKGLPKRGRYKDFYVELTMVVRRYVQRKYGIRAPHLTTEEFFAELARSRRQTAEQANMLRQFLESADLVKFAGVEATPEMAEAATESARGYLKSDTAEVVK